MQCLASTNIKLSESEIQIIRWLTRDITMIFSETIEVMIEMQSSYATSLMVRIFLVDFNDESLLCFGRDVQHLKSCDGYGVGLGHQVS